MFQHRFPVAVLAEGVSYAGKKKICGSKYGDHSWLILMRNKFLIGMKHLLMEALLRQKKGRGSRKDQEGQRNEVDGGGRRSGYSTWKPYRLCLAGRSHPCRQDTRTDQSRTKRPSKNSTQKADCR